MGVLITAGGQADQVAVYCIVCTNETDLFLFLWGGKEQAGKMNTVGFPGLLLQNSPSS